MNPFCKIVARLFLALALVATSLIVTPQPVYAGAVIGGQFTELEGQYISIFVESTVQMEAVFYDGHHVTMEISDVNIIWQETVEQISYIQLTSLHGEEISLFDNSTNWDDLGYNLWAKAPTMTVALSFVSGKPVLNFNVKGCNGCWLIEDETFEEPGWHSTPQFLAQFTIDAEEDTFTLEGLDTIDGFVPFATGEQHRFLLKRDLLQQSLVWGEVSIHTGYSNYLPVIVAAP